MNPSIIYLGDDHLGGAASYLAGVMTHAGLTFDYLPSREPVAAERLAGRGCLILSDYPAANLDDLAMAAIVDQVTAGTGLLMIGGWESFSGRDREYTDTPLADVLPVVMADGDDRVNSAQPVVIEKVADHAIVADLPWDQPPCIGGYNRFDAKPEAVTVLRLRHVRIKRADDRYEFVTGQTAPLLVIGEHGSGRVAALATDVAPHWVGGFVDWGDRRIDAAGPKAEPVQVGSWYARFFASLVGWTAKRF